MISDQILLFSGLGAGIGFVHTLFGPDHYVPFVFIARARNWRLQKTIWITILCGLGHVGSSILLGFAGIVLGQSLENLTSIEEIRGNWAAWAFTVFGFVYLLWGLYRAWKKSPHRHLSGSRRLHEHMHDHADVSGGTIVVADKSEKKASITPWVLFIIFVLGPCEPLIPTVIYPAINERGSIAEAVIVSLVFTVVTLVTMVTMVVLLERGVTFIGLKKMERYTHALAGAMLLISGIGILFLGL
jgi:sulfite exporter TauE/SafE